ncbi:MAG: PEP/pyruvate-binding domain-containing protein [Gallionellaceae bacterium]|nr:PEP/pyruvate-binding domain-containing protein [Gallionellaceae bacterium]
MSAHPEEGVISTGIRGLDDVLDGLRIGDNVVWRVDDLTDYRRFVFAFVDAARAQGRDIIYLRWGHQAPLLTSEAGLHIVAIDALGGFEAFTRQVYQQISEHGRGAFYVCDSLSDLVDAWATDYMVGNFFRVICPHLFDLDTVAYFALQPQSHSHGTLARIRETTQVLIDVHHVGDEMQVQPIKVWQRRSPTMFLPHRQRGAQFVPVIDSSEASRLQALLEARHQQLSQHRLLDHWDRLFLRAAQIVAGEAGETEPASVHDQIVNALIAREPRMQTLARRYFDLEDLLNIHARMIGSGYIGGKATGMLLARKILQHHAPEIANHHIEPHDSYYLGSDVYYAYMVHNGWWPLLMRQRSEAGYLSEGEVLRAAMLHGSVPPEIHQALERMLDHYGQYPILVRSSSLLEDGFGNAFAGKYESIFCVNQGSPEQRLAELEDAIRKVYASTMSEDALHYRLQRGLAGQEEPMALLLQRVNGRYHDNYYFPDAAGVGISRNTFVWDEDMDPAAGMLRLVMGLGTRAVNRIGGDHACVIALDEPHKHPYRNRDDLYRFSQQQVDVLNITDNCQQSVPLRELLAGTPTLPVQRFGELDREASEHARALGQADPVWRITFDSLLRDGRFVPLAQHMLKTLEAAYQHPVDVEFTVHLDGPRAASFNIVQCRPLATLGTARDVVLPEQVAPERLFFATHGHFMGGNIDQPIARIIHVDAHRYSALGVQQKYAVARLVGRLNRALADRVACPVLLIGPGRWGTSSPELGVPVCFADISQVAVLVEVAEMHAGMVPDLSFGTHFFQDLVETSIAYVALFPGERGCDYRGDWLERLPDQSRVPLPPDAVTDPAVAAAVTHYDVNGLTLHVMADVVAQRLYCFQDD